MGFELRAGALLRVLTPIVVASILLAGASSAQAATATFVSPTSTVSVPSGGSQLVTVSVRNDSTGTWNRGQDNLHFVDPLGHDLNYPYCGSDPRWVNGTTVFMDEGSVAPGSTAHFQVHVCGQPGYVGSATLRLQYVKEGVAHYDPIFPLSLNFYGSSGPGTPPPSAAGAFEPNDTRDRAYGPLAAASFYSAQLESKNDLDFYRFHTTGPTQMVFTVSNNAAARPCFGPQLTLLDSRGEAIDSSSAQATADSVLSYSSRGASSYFLKIESRFNTCDPPVSEYTLSIDSSLPLGDGPSGPTCAEAKAKVKKLKAQLKKAAPSKKSSLRNRLKKARATARAAC